MYVDLLCPSSSWQYIAKPRLYNCNLAENRSGFYYTSKLSNCSECFKLKRQTENNPCVKTILFHYLAHKFILGTHFISSFAAFPHLYAQFVVTNPGTKQGWECMDTGGGGTWPLLPCPAMGRAPAQILQGKGSFRWRRSRKTRNDVGKTLQVVSWRFGDPVRTLGCDPGRRVPPQAH